MSQLPPPGWYADPHGFSAYRWWDGLTWTAHTNGGLATADTAAAIAPAAAQQGFFAGTVTPRQHQYPPAQPTPYGPNSSGGSRSQTSGWHRNEYAFITFGTFAIYAYLALAAHHYFLGIGFCGRVHAQPGTQRAARHLGGHGGSRGPPRHRAPWRTPTAEPGSVFTGSVPAPAALLRPVQRLIRPCHQGFHVVLRRRTG